MLKFRTDPLFFVSVIVVFVILITGIVPQTVLAHRVTVFAWVEGDTIHTQSRFTGGRAVKNGHISVYDAQGGLRLTGHTDAAGEFDFDLPKSAGARIVLDAGMGHGNEWVLSDREEQDESPTNGHKSAILSASDSKNIPIEQAQGHLNKVIDFTREEVKAIIEETVDRKLKPIMKTLLEINDDRPSLADIIGGIGYIIGLVGVGAYVHSRKKQ